MDPFKDFIIFLCWNSFISLVSNAQILNPNLILSSGGTGDDDTPKITYNQIHILYAGKISTGIINDAFLALNVIKYLPENYRMHIAGYGTDSDILELKEKINEMIFNITGLKVRGITAIV